MRAQFPSLRSIVIGDSLHSSQHMVLAVDKRENGLVPVTHQPQLRRQRPVIIVYSLVQSQSNLMSVPLVLKHLIWVITFSNIAREKRTTLTSSSKSTSSISSPRQSKQKVEPVKSLTRPERVITLLSNPQTKAYCMFLKNTLPIFDKANLILQKDEPCIHLLHQTLVDQLRTLFTRFLRPSSIQKYKVHLHQLPYHKSNHQRDTAVKQERFWRQKEWTRTDSIAMSRDSSAKQASTWLLNFPTRTQCWSMSS